MAACNVRIPWNDVVRLREIYEKGEATPRHLATQFKISLKYVYQLLHGQARQHEKTRRPIAISEPMLTRQRIQDPKGNKFIQSVSRVSRWKRQIDFRVVCAIRYACNHTGMSMSDAATKFGCSYATVRRIIRKESRVSQ